MPRQSAIDQAMRLLQTLVGPDVATWDGSCILKDQHGRSGHDSWRRTEVDEELFPP